ncbi:MAG: efflux RND transporter periplasmic adaptor subunit, partial [Rhodanobacteraceae bacterium]
MAMVVQEEASSDALVCVDEFGNSSSEIARTHAWPRAITAACLAIVASIAAPRARAGDDIALSAAQIEAIGIEVRRLDKPSRSAGIAYPARAVLPRDKDEMISAAVAGRIERILVEDHAEVKAGQPLLRINSPAFDELQLELLQARNEARVAESARAREKQLYGEGIIPERRVIEADAAASTARAAEQHARAALRLVGADDSTIDRIAAGHVQDRLEIRAPRAATVLAIEVKTGQRVADADPMLRLGELGTLWLDIDLPAMQASAWDPRGEIRVAGRDLQAKPVSASAHVNGSQTVTLRAEVTHGAELLRPGEFVQAQVPLKTSGDAWIVPNAALVHEGDRTIV